MVFRSRFYRFGYGLKWHASARLNSSQLSNLHDARRPALFVAKVIYQPEPLSPVQRRFDTYGDVHRLYYLPENLMDTWSAKEVCYAMGELYDFIYSSCLIYGRYSTGIKTFIKRLVVILLDSLFLAKKSVEGKIKCAITPLEKGFIKLLHFCFY